jgi:hypothetical protein
MWEVISLITQTAIFGILLCGVYEYVRQRRRIVILMRMMNCDELIDQLLEEHVPEPGGNAGSRGGLRDDDTKAISTGDNTVCHKRNRLAALAARDQARQYLGKPMTVEQIVDAPDDEIVKLYARYESTLGAAMIRTLGAAAVWLYATAAGAILPIPQENQPMLVTDLEADPIVSHALNTAACELYHRCGVYLAPLTVALTTARYCQFELPQPRIDDDDAGTAGERCGDRSAGGAGEGDVPPAVSRDDA